MNITSNNTMIFAKEFEGKMYYRAGLSNKKQDGSYEKGYIDVKFPKDVKVADRSKINIQQGFLTFYKNKEGKDVFYIVVQDFSYSVTIEKTQVMKVESINAEDLDLPLPF